MESEVLGSDPYIEVYGNDTNVGLELTTKGTGRVKMNTVNIPTISSTDTITNKTLALGSNTIS